jgi:hypothetical protein
MVEAIRVEGRYLGILATVVDEKFAPILLELRQT